MRKPRKNKSERVQDAPQKPKAAPAATASPERALRGQRLKALMQLRDSGDAVAEAEIVQTLVTSISQAGDKQPARAEWLGISPRYLRHLLSAEVGLTRDHPEVHGRIQGLNDLAETAGPSAESETARGAKT